VVSRPKGLAHFVRQERSDSTKCDKESIRLKLLLVFFSFLYIISYTGLFTSFSVSK
jgi:hypothetical protein